MSLNITKVNTIPDLYILTPRIFSDPRGYFLETFKEKELKEAGIIQNFVQDNFSLSSKGTLRGTHFQREPMAQGKLVSVVHGAVWDVAVDLRKDSATFGRWYGIELNDENHITLYLPPGFGHAFIALKNNTKFTYKCTNYYSPEHESGVRWDDPDIDIKWPIENPLISGKDADLPLLKDLSI